jgi:hypothetical protein
LIGLASANHLQGEAPRAVVLLAESLSLFRDVGDRRGAALATLYLADVQMDRGNLTDAAVQYQEAVAEFATLGDCDRVVEGLLKLGGLMVREGKFEAAAKLLGAASAMEPDDEPEAGKGSPENADLVDQLNTVRGALGEEAFTAAWDAGHALSLDAAVRVALSSASH